jgi:CBS domain containing-hemolysin-like protein
MMVPDTKTVRETLAEMLDKKVHVAIAADEYGGTAGLISLEDIVESVFGEIQDEYEQPEDEPPRIELKMLPSGGGTADADARAYIDDVNTALEPLGVSLPDSDEYDTLGGFVLSTLGRIPDRGEAFTHERCKVTVVEASPTRVLRVRLDVSPGSDAAPANGQDVTPQTTTAK